MEEARRAQRRRAPRLKSSVRGSGPSYHFTHDPKTDRGRRRHLRGRKRQFLAFYESPLVSSCFSKRATVRSSQAMGRDESSGEGRGAEVTARRLGYGRRNFFLGALANPRVVMPANAGIQKPRGVT